MQRQYRDVKPGDCVAWIGKLWIVVDSFITKDGLKPAIIAKLNKEGSSLAIGFGWEFSKIEDFKNG